MYKEVIGGNDKEKKVKKVIEWVFTAWIFLSIALMIIFMGINIPIAIIIFGQCFFAMAMYLFSDRKSDLMSLFTLTIGIIVMLAPFVIKIFPRFSDLSTKDYINYGIPIASMLLGYFFISISRFKEEKRAFYICYTFAWIFLLIGIIKTIQFCL